MSPRTFLCCENARLRKQAQRLSITILILSPFALWGLLDIVARLMPGGWPL